MSRKLLVVLTITALMSISPVPLHAWRLEGDTIQPALIPPSGKALVPADHADLDGDGVDERLALLGGQASITTEGELRWQSPQGWDVSQAAFSDLNQDGVVEAVLLVWRPFKPWPVDQWLPNGGRIEEFHNLKGDSCHIVLIGSHRGKYTERWAGSAMSQPVAKFALADLNQDGFDELITLETRYEAAPASPAESLKVWEWNGFGFGIVSEKDGVFHDLEVVLVPGQKSILVTP